MKDMLVYRPVGSPWAVQCSADSGEMASGQGIWMMWEVEEQGGCLPIKTIHFFQAMKVEVPPDPVAHAAYPARDM